MSASRPRPLCDFHVHTTYSDGGHAPHEVAAAAYEMGFTALGFSTHSYTHFDESYCIRRERIASYLDEIAAVRREYDGRMKIYAGVEQDYYSDHPTDAFDYVIGSVHYLCVGGTYYAIDHRRDLILNAAEEAFGGDIYALVEEYYRVAGDIIEKTHPDLIGHFDVITKFNEKNPFFDETHPRYLAARQAALDKLLVGRVPFEVNTGAISRGHKTSPYPASDALDYIGAHGGKVILSSDSHAKSTIAYAFDEASALVDAMGFNPASATSEFLARLDARRMHKS